MPPKASKLATNSVFAQYAKPAPTSDAAPVDDDDGFADRPGTPTEQKKCDTNATDAFSPPERSLPDNTQQDRREQHNGAPVAPPVEEDEWAAASKQHQKKLDDFAAKGEGAAQGHQVQPIQYGEAYLALRNNKAAWGQHKGDIKRIADHVKEQGGFWSCLWGCMHSEIADDSEDFEDRDFILCLAKVGLDPSDDIHRRMLLTIHRKITKPKRSEPDCQMVGKHWEPLGFQGLNPGTDLRSNGMLGLLQMLYLLEFYPPFASALWNSAKSPLTEFPLALVCLNYTGITLEALRDKALHDDIHSRRREANTKGAKTSEVGSDAAAAGYAGAVGSMAGGVSRVDVVCPVLESMNKFYVGCLFSFLKEWKEQDTRAIQDFAPINQKLRMYARDNAKLMIKRGTDACKREAIAGLGKKDDGDGPGGVKKDELEFHSF